MKASATRRAFLKSSAALAATLTVASNAHAKGDDLLKVGLIGCGSRGTGAASQALRADRNVKLWAMGDAFEDRLESSLGVLGRDMDIAGKLDVARERRFVGFNAYERVIGCCDVVLLCTPPGFRPLHLRAAVNANKHVFAEKPVAVDAPGVRSVLETVREARRRNLSLVSGLCLRYDNGFKETVRRIHDGAIGDLHTLQASDYRGGIWVRPRQEGWSDMTWQMRNWYYFTWLSGDFNVEQHIHFLDVSAWVMQEKYPERASGSGGRQVRTGPEFGNIFDHHAVNYEFAAGPTMLSQTRQQAGCSGDMSVQVIGTKGHANLSEGKGKLSITPYFDSSVPSWRYRGPDNDVYQSEHDDLFAAG